MVGALAAATKTVVKSMDCPEVIWQVTFEAHNIESTEIGFETPDAPI